MSAWLDLPDLKYWGTYDQAYQKSGRGEMKTLEKITEIILRLIVCNICKGKFYDLDEIVINDDEVICIWCEKARAEKMIERLEKGEGCKK